MRFVTITSGKGGVGKSTLAANLSYTLSSYGYKVALFDADIGLANQDIILGVKPKATIIDVLQKKVSFEEILIQINENFFFIPGENGDEILQYKNSEVLEYFFKGLERLKDFDFLIIDTGAGIGESVQAFVKASTDTIVVTIPDPSAIMDAYSMIKYSSKIKDKIFLIVNRVKNAQEARELAAKLQRVAKAYLEKMDVEFLGFVQRSSLIEEASKRRELIARDYASSLPALQIADIAKKLTNYMTKEGEHIKQTPNITIFFKRLLQQF